jgi:hypothetical protein
MRSVGHLVRFTFDSESGIVTYEQAEHLSRASGSCVSAAVRGGLLVFPR